MFSPVVNTRWKHVYEPETLMEVPASMTPLFGRTQYLRGAVVLTLKHTFLSVGLVSFKVAVMTSVNGPEGETNSSMYRHFTTFPGGRIKPKWVHEAV